MVACITGLWSGNILYCKLAILPESKKCKKVISLSGDFGMDQYVSCWLPAAELNLDTIWSNYEDFCKPQANEVWARFDLLTNFWQGNRSVDEWYNAVQAQVGLAQYPKETADIFHHDIICFFWPDEESVLKAINDSSIGLDKPPASKVRQLGKKMEVSKATVRCIKQVASHPQAAQINLVRHQQTDLQPGKCKRKAFKPWPQRYRDPQVSNKPHHTKEDMIPNKLIQAKISVLNVVIPSMLKDSIVQLRKY